jgi:hypothetical protein
MFDHALASQDGPMASSKALFVAVVLVPASAVADPAYLKCSLPVDSERMTIQLKIDESTGKITHTQDNGLTFNAEGFFAANTIKYQKIDSMGGLMKVVMVYEINRSTLEFTRVMQVQVNDAVQPRVDQSSGSSGAQVGRCDVVRISDRKI